MPLLASELRHVLANRQKGAGLLGTLVGATVNSAVRAATGRLRGVAVAMTPFCSVDPNEATKGFRFWATGYWASLLGKRPYHISALFVVDLRLFRLPY